MEWVLCKYFRCFQWMYGPSVLTGVSGRTDDLHDQNEYVFCFPTHSLLLPFSHLFHCLPYSSFITELPEYQIIAKSSANITRFLCLQWNYANFYQLKIWFSFSSPDLFYHRFIFANNSSTNVFFYYGDRNFYAEAIISLWFFYSGYKVIVRTMMMSCWNTDFTEHRSVGALYRRGGSVCLFFLFWSSLSILVKQSEKEGEFLECSLFFLIKIWLIQSYKILFYHDTQLENQGFCLNILLNFKKIWI